MTTNPNRNTTPVHVAPPLRARAGNVLADRHDALAADRALYQGERRELEQRALQAPGGGD